MTARFMSQHAPYPDELERLVGELSYREPEGWRVWLQDDLERDPGSKGLTLVVQRLGPDSYHPEKLIRVSHYFPVPPATYDRDSWMRWIFDRLGDVDTHERMEDFTLAEHGSWVNLNGDHVTERVTRPYAPNHGPGRNPYVVHDYATATDRRTSFRGELNDG